MLTPKDWYPLPSLVMSDDPGDDVPEYPDDGGDRDEYINSADHTNIEDIDDEDLDEL